MYGKSHDTAINYKPSICHAFWSSPPAYGNEEEEPEMPNDITAGNAGKAMLAQYLIGKQILKRLPSIFSFGLHN